MNFLKRNNILFIWVPKNAGTSIFKLFEPYGCKKYKSIQKTVPKFPGHGFATFGHISIPSLINQKILSKDFVNKAFVFAFVRNPYDRLVSLYYYKGKVRKQFKHYTFENFCDLILSKEIPPIGYYNTRGLSQANPQYHWLFDKKGNPFFDFLGRVENIQTDINALCNAFGLEHKRILRANATAHKDYKKYYSKALKLDVYNYYKTDFKLFGYKK